MKMPALLVLSFLAASLIGCNRDHSGDPGTCLRPNLNTCLEYTQVRGGLGQKLCSDATWTAGMGTCPTENLIGICVREEGNQMEYLYSGEPLGMTAEESKKNCEGTGGTWKES